MLRTITQTAASLAVVSCLMLHHGRVAVADPCGMVPPITIDDGTSLVRVGDQQTYVFFKDGVESFVIRPGFSGKVEDFGMLIPFPTPPAIRKVPENIFPHITAAVDPPEVVVDLRIRAYELQVFNRSYSDPSRGARPDGLRLKAHEVRVLDQQAVGMYEVAVLEAGSPEALKKWMEQHKYKYPDGMDKVCEDYIDDRWCFVAVKTKVGGKRGVDPAPGRRGVDDRLPSGSTFDGHVQAMGFRFKTEKLVVPMRLSAFNEGELRNIVYLLTDGPRRIRSIPEEYVVRQVTGEELFRNVTSPLPLRVIGGTVSEIPDWQRKSLPTQRDPAPHNGVAKELFAGDLLAERTGTLSHAHEESEKMLLRIGEHFGLRGPAIDEQNLAVLQKQRSAATAAAVAELKKMTLTVIDGDFPREVLTSKNLLFSTYSMPPRRNSPRHYDAKFKTPQADPGGVITTEKLGAVAPSPRRFQLLESRGLGAVLSFVFAVTLLGYVAYRGRTGSIQ